MTGSDSTALEDAVVTVTNTATGERWQTATRARGRYVFEYLSVGGPYLLEARAIGFAPARDRRSCSRWASGAGPISP